MSPSAAIRAFWVAIIGALTAAGAAVLLSFNFDEFDAEGSYLDRHVENEWYRAIALLLVVLLASAILRRIAGGVLSTSYYLGSLFGETTVLGHALATGRVSGGNLWMGGVLLWTAGGLAAGALLRYVVRPSGSRQD